MKYTLIKNTKDFKELAPAWNTLLAQSITNVPFLRHEYLYTWWASLGGGEWEEGELTIIIAKRENELVGIAPLFQNGKKLHFLGSVEISDFLDFIVRKEDLDEFLSGLLDFLESPAISGLVALNLQNLLQDSPSLQALQAACEARGWGYAQSILQPAPYLTLPGDFDEYLSGIKKKQRHEIRRKLRRVESDERNIRWYIVEDKDTLDAEIESCCHLMAQDPEKQAFLTELMRSQMNTAIHAAFDAGWLQLAFLEVDGEKAAGYLNFDYGNRIWVYNSGMDMKHSDISPGWVLLAYILQWANENGRTEFDFMRGDEPYKYKFGGVDRFVVKVEITI